jgi:hypothetical protein
MHFSLPHALEILERTPATFRGLLDGLTDAWLLPNEGPETFSALDNLGHMIHAERTDWIPRAEVILAQGVDLRFPPFDRYGHLQEQHDMDIGELLDEFARLRDRNLLTLRGWKLGPAELALAGEHPTFGRVSLEQLLSAWVVHDLGHVAQTSRVMAKQYREAVGPWRAFLPVLDR